MKYLCINLNKDKYRYNKFMKMMEKINLKDVVRIEGVVGKNVPIEQVNKMMTIYAKNVLTRKLPRETHEHFNTYGALGCYLSHVKCWRYIVDNDLDNAIIFEDDAVVNLTNFYKNFSPIMKELQDEKADVCFLGYINRTKLNIYSNNLYKLDDMIFQAHAYYISNHGARILLNNCFPVEMHVDSYIPIMCIYYLKGFLSRNQIFYQANETKSNTYEECDLCGELSIV